MEQRESDCCELEKIEITMLLEAIYRYYGFDFRNYAFSSIRRRIKHRLRAEKLLTISGLQEKVLHDSSCLERLLYDFSINITEMFRDPGSFKVFREIAVPALRTLPNLRIWHAGCSTGEEVYSMAILLHEEGLLHKSTLWATDINDKVLREAEKGIFPLQRMQGYTTNYLQSGGKRAFSEYYTVKNDQVVFNADLLKHLVFAQHNLVTDCSFNEFQVIFCRNVMIYFDLTLQNRVHQLFYESLAQGGFLGLGNRETLRFSNFAEFYKELDSDHKLYLKVK
ncbi:MAG: protein-glutamate O-methyltransferase CheR [Desulfitobacterium hafniense]|nr:protein-glutamate O-methyltransferase CheR [Desulfitobacterium hafniense]